MEDGDATGKLEEFGITAGVGMAIEVVGDDDVGFTVTLLVRDGVEREGDC